MAEPQDFGIELADGGSATTHLHSALGAAVEEYPEVFATAGFPADVSVFKSNYADILPVFEAARADSPQRADIARTIVTAAHDAIVMNPAGVALADAVAEDSAPLDLETWSPGGSRRLTPAVPFDGRSVTGDELVAAVDALVARGSASSPVGHAIRWIVDQATSMSPQTMSPQTRSRGTSMFPETRAGGTSGIDLRGRRIAMLGAGAELAPTRLWLDAGADVLWIDLDEPPADLRADGDLAGSLHWVPGGVDLLVDPHKVRATIDDFAAGEPIDIGLYAYAPGRAREWRLTAAMNAIVDALPRRIVRSVAMLVSPTTCGVLTNEDLAIEADRLADRPRWQRGARAARLLGRTTGHATSGATAANRGVVSIQGGSYQAAQYVAKLLTAEAWATDPEPIAVSANTAGISLTESLHHPVFDLAFAGASAFGVETFDPPTTAALNGLLTLHDRLDPAMTERGVDELFATRVHGGIYVTPYPIDPALRIAAGIGVLKDPRRVGALATAITRGR